MDSTAHKLLASLGLTETEATIYLAGLELSPCTPQTLSLKTNVKRPTVYHALDTLREKGFVSELKIGNKSHFTMMNPESLRGLVSNKKIELEQQELQLASLIPFLSDLQLQKNLTEVIHGHGKEGAKRVLDAAFRTKTKQWDIIAPYENFLRHDKELAELYLTTRKVRDIRARTLWELRRDERPLSEAEVEIRNPRILPPALAGKFESMILIFDDKVAIFSSHKNLSAILITSNEINALFKAMFEGLWELSEPY
jgi:sugar-specific transcriptional regulator TrmB